MVTAGFDSLQDRPKATFGRSVIIRLRVYLCLFSHSPSTLTTNESLHRYQGRPSGSGAWVLSDFGGATADERMGGAMTPGIITSLFAPSKALNI
ncbi:hypothetical protein Q8A67_018497 [Cirrhinus molitorella]|uniref:Uncharacterized protein n=1 Tax=Cirrhinus molitorella TaxID=172907 RepID=A0AA88PHT0_9TELE|nr:hypothetical protein Q8A67_018497 [Cirrhinus molitorella]